MPSFILQWFQVVQIHHLTSHPGGIVTSWSMSWTPIRPASLRTASTSSFGTHRDAGSPYRASGYYCSVHTTTDPTRRSAWVDTSPPLRATFCWAVTGWCQLHHSACPQIPSRTDQMLWHCIAALSAHHQPHKGGSRPEACWMQSCTGREGPIRRRRSWVKLWHRDSCLCWRIQTFCLVTRPSAAVEAFTRMTCRLFQWVQRVKVSSGMLTFNCQIKMAKTQHGGKTNNANAQNALTHCIPYVESIHKPK